MYGKRKINRSGTLLAAQMMCEKQDSCSSVKECTTRKMTPEEWEKYGPLNIIDSKLMKKNKN
ncbi:hypothetical protein [Desulfosporosinus orientis]|uniref:hypothetical protein n=1 Tax=Desulfosporosinus orientis TaxID=1563 RepID=UPI0002D77EE7|nr:hypothetical protein [Desulfosporosinus orientis]